MTAHNNSPFQVRELLERLNDYRSLGDKRSFEKYARQGELDGERICFWHGKDMIVLMYAQISFLLSAQPTQATKDLLQVVKSLPLLAVTFHAQYFALVNLNLKL